MFIRKKISQDQIVILGKFIEDHLQDRLRLDNNIRAIGLSNKEVDSVDTGTLSICFFVDTKKQVEDLKARELIEKHIEVPELGIQISTDVHEIGGYLPIIRWFQKKMNLTPTSEFVKRESDDYEEVRNNVLTKHPRRLRQEMIQPGHSVGSLGRTETGTLGLIVYANNEPHLISNQHILGNRSSRVIQPGIKDLGSVVDYTGYHIGDVIDSFDDLDISIAKMTNRSHKPEIFGFESPVTPKFSEDPVIGDHVIKSGRMTGITHGVIKSIKAIVKQTGGRILKRQFIVGIHPDYPPPYYEITKAGDSGSPWLKVENYMPSRNMIGIHVGGEANTADKNPSLEYAHGTELSAVLEQFDFTFNKV